MARIRPSAVVFHEKEIPHIITAMYKLINRAAKCRRCGRKPHFIRLQFLGERIKKAYKLCRRCEAILARK